VRRVNGDNNVADNDGGNGGSGGGELDFDDLSGMDFSMHTGGGSGGGSGGGGGGGGGGELNFGGGGDDDDDDEIAFGNSSSSSEAANYDMVAVPKQVSAIRCCKRVCVCVFCHWRIDVFLYLLLSSSYCTRPFLKQTAAINIGFAQFAKKIDVRALKSSLWKRLGDGPPTVKAEKNDDDDDDATDDDDDDDNDENGSEEATSFQKAISELALPASVAKNVSVPFCFICLLHLANEKSLTLTQEVVKGGSDNTEKKKTKKALTKKQIAAAKAAAALEELTDETEVDPESHFNLGDFIIARNAC
jgi:hypothetical protein